jgi:hypothetical protein
MNRWAASLDRRLALALLQLEAQGAESRIAPGRPLQVLSEPGNLGRIARFHVLAQEPFSPLQDSKFLGKGNRLLEELQDIRIPLRQFPIEPTDLIVLAVGVVIALLRPAHFITGQHHRRSPTYQQDRQGILDLLQAKSGDLSVLRRAFPAAVPAVVVIGAVGVPFAIGVVVLAVIRDEVHECEAVMGGDEVYRG